MAYVVLLIFMPTHCVTVSDGDITRPKITLLTMLARSKNVRNAPENNPICVASTNVRTRTNRDIIVFKARVFGDGRKKKKEKKSHPFSVHLRTERVRVIVFVYILKSHRYNAISKYEYITRTYSPTYIISYKFQ